MGDGADVGGSSAERCSQEGTKPGEPERIAAESLELAKLWVYLGGPSHERGREPAAASSLRTSPVPIDAVNVPDFGIVDDPHQLMVRDP
jgi:hypothetical protein